MNELRNSVARFVDLQLNRELEINYHIVVSHIFDIIQNIGTLEYRNVAKKDIIRVLEGAVSVISGSPFFYSAIGVRPRLFP